MSPVDHKNVVAVLWASKLTIIPEVSADLDWKDVFVAPILLQALPFFFF